MQLSNALKRLVRLLSSVSTANFKAKKTEDHRRGRGILQFGLARSAKRNLHAVKKSEESSPDEPFAEPPPSILRITLDTAEPAHLKDGSRIRDRAAPWLYKGIRTT